MAKYQTKINLNKRKQNMVSHSRFARKNKRNYFTGTPKFSNPLNRLSKAKREKVQKVGAIILGVFFIAFLSAFIGLMFYIKSVTEELPSPDAPFGDKAEATIIYASNQNPETGRNEQLYTLFGEEDREFIEIESIPDHVKWSFLAAEDVDFYEHPGFDLGGLVKAGLYEVFKIGSPRGGSTVTQQLIKQTVVGSDRTYERKIKEILMAMEVERRYSKDEILEMYLNTINFGSNKHGLKRAAEFYYGKDVKDLTLAEAAVLARIPNSPTENSPTLSPNGAENALIGKAYTLDQMERNLDKINDRIESDDNIILKEEIEEARNAEMVYIEPRIDIEAPHFVFYVQKLLTTKGYNNGEPFDLNELRTGGFNVYTTLDTTIQDIAVEEVENAAVKYAAPFGASNAAVIITKPGTGDVLAMVGSKSYDAPSEGTKFDGKVNVTDSLQSMGSSMKPMAYTKAFELGISSPGSYLPDIPIQIGAYKPRNYNGGFKGPETGATAREQLRESKNIPPIILVDAMGVDVFVDSLAKWGYETIERNKGAFGHSLVLGGGDVTMVEHAQGYGVLANGGQIVKIDPIQKITKIDPTTQEEKVIYEKEPKKEVVADQRATYMTTHILNFKNRPNAADGYIDGRDFAGKTGTSEAPNDTLFWGYTPDFVIGGWVGNNDNSAMRSNADGGNVTQPWVMNILKRIAPYFPEKTPFSRPGQIISGNACSSSENQEEGVECSEQGGDLVIEGKLPPAYIYKKKYTVCTDQPDRLARDIDKQVGKATDVEVKIYKMPSPALQKFLDEATKSLIPTELCDISRSPNEGNPWAVINSPADAAAVSGSLPIDIKGYSAAGYVTKMEVRLGGTSYSKNVNTADFTDSVDVTGFESGTYTLSVKVYDNTGLVGENSVKVNINGNNTNFSVSTSPGSPTSGNAATINASYSGSFSITSMRVVVVNPSNANEVSGADIMSGSYSWSPLTSGAYKVYIVATSSSGVTMRSNSINVTVN